MKNIVEFIPKDDLIVIEVNCIEFIEGIVNYQEVLVLGLHLLSTLSVVTEHLNSSAPSVGAGRLYVAFGVSVIMFLKKK